MRTVAVAFILSALCSVVLTPLVRDLSRRFGWLDRGLNSRKIHGRPVPRLGGVAIVLGFYAPLVGLLLVDSATGRQFLADRERALGLILGGAAIALLGVYDDLRGSGATKKFLVQFAVAYAMYRLGFRVDQVTNPFGPAIQLGALGLPFTMLWIVGVVNAVNLIDGLDGLAGGVALIAVGTTFVVALQQRQPIMLLFSASLAGAVLGFLRYNFSPASVFMGDSGSMFLGFVLATSAIQTNQKASTAVAMLVPIVALGLPIGDTLLAMARRALRGAPLFHSDRGHIHHRLMARGLTQRQTVVALYGVCAVLAAAAIALTRLTGFGAAAVLVFIGFAAAGVLYWAGYLRLDRTAELRGDRRRNLEMHAAVREAAEMLQRAAQPYDVWRCVRDAAPVVGATCVELRLGRQNGAERAVSVFTLGFDEAGSDLLRARYSLLGERPDDGSIELGWDDGRATVDRDTEIAIELLCEQILVAVNRIYWEREGGASGSPEAGKVVRLRG